MSWNDGPMCLVVYVCAVRLRMYVKKKSHCAVGMNAIASNHTVTRIRIQTLIINWLSRIWCGLIERTRLSLLLSLFIVAYNYNHPNGMLIWSFFLLLHLFIPKTSQSLNYAIYVASAPILGGIIAESISYFHKPYYGDGTNVVSL